MAVSARKNRIIIFLICLVSVLPLPCHAENFQARVDLAKSIERDPAYKAYNSEYNQVNYTELAAVMKSCTAKYDITSPFTLVAYIDPAGHAVHVEMQPVNELTDCVSEGFKKIENPSPPAVSGHEGFPVTIYMEIKP